MRLHPQGVETEVVQVVEVLLEVGARKGSGELHDPEVERIGCLRKSRSNSEAHQQGDDRQFREPESHHRLLTMRHIRVGRQLQPSTN